MLFDALGTLLDLRPPGPALVGLLRDRHGIEVSLAQAQGALAAEMAFYRANNHLAANDAGLATLRRRCGELLRDHLPVQARRLGVTEITQALLDSLRFVAYPDVWQTLAALRGRQLRTAIVSNWDISLHQVLADTGVGEQVDVVVTSAQVGAGKPAPAIFAAALARLDVESAHALHVGDSPAEDVGGARAAGVEAVLLARTPTRCGSAPVIESLTQLPALLDAS